MNLGKAIKELKFQTVGMNQKYRPYADQVLNLFKDSKIEKRKEAEKLLDQLASRGKAPQAAIKKLNEKYSKAESATGKLERRELKTFFVSGITHHIITYEQKLKKLGRKIRCTDMADPATHPREDKRANRTRALHHLISL